MIRHPDWQARLTAYLAQVSATAFAPGHLDCALFAAGAVEAQTGVDHADDWRGRYIDLAEGMGLLAEAGHADHVALVATLLPEVPVAEAQPGDIVVMPLGRALPSLGVVQGSHAYLLVEDGRGLVLRPMGEAVRAFRVAT